MLTTPYVSLTVLLDFIATNLGDALQFKDATVFNSHTAVADRSPGIALSFMLNEGSYLRNILYCPSYGLFFAC